MKIVLGLVLAAAVAGAAGAVTRPDPNVQAQADGCGRDMGALFRKEAPTWVYVNDRDLPANGPAPPPQWATGVVSSGGQPPFFASHPTPVDDPVSHDSYDVVFNIRPDAAYSGLLGGDPATSTGNFAGQDEETGRLHTELEQNAFPAFAWPEEGDRVSVFGSWVWDCGHWLPGGEQTELHPFRALWVDRGVSPRSPQGEVEGDLLITTDKTPAGKSADCAHRAKGVAAAFKSCLGSEPDWYDANGAYSFAFRVPPKPSPGAKLHVRVLDAGSLAAGAVRARFDGRRVKVSVKVDAPAGKRVVVAKRVLAGWWPLPAAKLPLHLRLGFRELLVRRAMDPGCPRTSPDCASVETTKKDQITVPPGEWAVYSDVAGIWSAWPLLRPRDGQRIRLTRRVDFYVASGSPWRLFVFARECDFGTLSASDPGRPPGPCPPSGEFGDASGDDSPGSIVDRYSSARVGHGSHRSNALREGSSCPAANRGGCYLLTYTVELIDDAAHRARARR